MQRNGVKSLQIHRKYWFRIQKSYVLIIYYFFIDVVMYSFFFLLAMFSKSFPYFFIHPSALPSLLLSFFHSLLKFFFCLFCADLSLLFFRIFSFPFSSPRLIEAFFIYFFYFFIFIIIFFFFFFFFLNMQCIRCRS